MKDNNLYFAKHGDLRGSHMKFFTRETAKLFNFNDVSEVFMTTNNRGTLRGLHRQTGEFPQQKITKVVNGKFNVRVIYPSDYLYPIIYNNDCTKIEETDKNDVIVYFDNRTPDSAPILVPKNALLSYVSLEDNSKMLYIADNPFVAKDDEGYNAKDPRFNIDWGIDSSNLTSSKRDSQSKNY